MYHMISRAKFYSIRQQVDVFYHYICSAAIEFVVGHVLKLFTKIYMHPISILNDLTKHSAFLNHLFFSMNNSLFYF